MHPTNKTILTLSQLHLEALGVSANDFRWSMSRREVAWHDLLVSFRHYEGFYHPTLCYRYILIIRPDTEFVESLSDRNWEGLLFFTRETWSGDGKRIFFRWHCNSCSVWGEFSFFSPYKEGEQEGLEELDVNVVRGIVQSVKVNCGCAAEEE